MDAQPYGVGASALLAAVPILWLLAALALLRQAAWRACLIGLGATALLAALAWKIAWTDVLRAGLEGALLGLFPILFVIFAAICTFNLTRETGAMDAMRRLLAGVTPDRRLQALLIAWGFGGFLEGAAGFGTAVAIPAAILIGLGFEPRRAAILCLVANTVPVAFGGVGLPVITLARVTDLDLARLTWFVALQLTPLVVVLPLALVTLLTRSLSGLKGVTVACLVAGVAFAAPQLVLARFAGPELTAIAGSLAAMLAVGLVARWLPPKSPWRFPGEAPPTEIGSSTSLREQIVAWSPYWAMLAFILGTGPLVPGVNHALASVQTSLAIVRGARPLAFAWIANPGTLILAGAIVGGLLQGARPGTFARVLKATARQLAPTAITVTAIVALARVMGHSGMSEAIAVALAAGTGPFYPALAPLVGALGTFVTGSDTSSNVLFGALQKQTALRIGADPCWIAAANAAGATAGKMISPQSIAVASSATGQQGREGELLRGTVLHALAYALVLGTIVLAFAR
jgi:lactate permease